MIDHVLIVGGSGFVGRTLVKKMLKNGYLVSVLSRNVNRTIETFPPGVKVVGDLSSNNGNHPYSIIINLAGETIAQYWTDNIKERIMDSRVEMNKKIVDYISKAQHKPLLFIAASGVGYYGIDLEEKFTEKSQPTAASKDLFIVSLCKNLERVARNAEEFGVRTCFLRSGVVLEKDGGMLSKLLLPYNMGLGGRIGSGRQWFSWIHRDDLINIIFHIIAHKTIHGPVNATSPNPVTNKQFTEILSRTVKRPAFFALPNFYIKLMFGQMGEELLLNGQYVVPKLLMDSNFDYKYPTLKDALMAITSY